MMLSRSPLVLCLLAAVTCGKSFAVGPPSHADTKANTGAWALDGNTGVAPDAFLGYADPASRSPLAFRVANQTVVRYLPSINNASGVPIAYSTVVGYSNGFVAGTRGITIAGGGSSGEAGVPLSGGNTVSDDYGTIGGGSGNRVGNFAGTTSDANFATVTGGLGNHAAAVFGTVGGGYANHASDVGATVAGGNGNAAGGAASTIGGGLGNRALGDYAVVPGGNNNCAGADYSFAGGRDAKVRPGSSPGAGTACSGLTYSGGDGDVGSFVWADAVPVAFSSSGANQFLVRAQGGVGINTAPTQGAVEVTVQTDADSSGDYANLWLKQRAASNNGILVSVGDGNTINNASFYIDHYSGTAQARRLELLGTGAVTIRSNITQANTGVTMAANAGSWSSLSDRHLKTAVELVDTGAILDSLLATPISTWSYIAQGTSVRHMGPMAQDFAAAFGLGENDTTISTVDADGVALAAIQGLAIRLQQRNTELEAKVDALSARIDQLEQPQ
jgi:hypothetical protein